MGEGGNSWLHKQWRDIAGNVKFWLVTFALGGLMTLVAVLTHGLKWWQQAGLVAIFTVFLLWAIIATVLSLKYKGPDVMRHLRLTELELEQQILEVSTTGLRTPSKLTIHSATYSAVEGGGKSYDVTDCLRQMISGDSLVLDIENHNFSINGRNYVPSDPKAFKEKRLLVTYSFDGAPETTLERPEHSRMVLPQDSEIERLSTEWGKCKDLFSPLQIEAFQLAKELRTFVVSLGPFPVFKPQPGEDQAAYLAAFVPLTMPWRKRLTYGYAADFADKVRKIGQRFGAENLSIERLGAKVDTVGTETDIEEIAEQLEILAVKLSFPPDRRRLRHES